MVVFQSGGRGIARKLEFESSDAWAMLFFLVTTLLASALGVGLALALQPGAAIEASVEVTGPTEKVPSKEVLDSFLDLVRSGPAPRGCVLI